MFGQFLFDGSLLLPPFHNDWCIIKKSHSDLTGYCIEVFHTQCSAPSRYMFTHQLVCIRVGKIYSPDIYNWFVIKMSNVTFEIMEVGNLYFKVHQIIIAQRPKYILIFGYAIYQSIFTYLLLLQCLSNTWYIVDTKYQWNDRFSIKSGYCYCK